MKRVPWMLFLAACGCAVGKPRLILDADTANEIDDLYAITRVFNQDKFEVLALNSAQWFHYLSGERSVYASQVLNQDLLPLLGRTDVPALLGADQAMGRPWGGTEPKDSAAARFIIEQAKAMPEGEKLYVASIGASTNLASALAMAPEIAPRVAAYLMGFKYDVERGVWNKSEFNVRRDLNAADYLLNAEGLELHIMTATTSRKFVFQREDTFERLKKAGDLGAYLTARWEKHAPDGKGWVMWDVALLEAMIDPELATEIEVDTPPENARRKVWVYSEIDAERMRAAFWASVIPQ